MNLQEAGEDLYRLLQRFYIAGYENRAYPRPLSKLTPRYRRPLRSAYREGHTQDKFENRLARVLYGV